MANSKESDFLRSLYQDWTDRMVADPNLSIANLRSMFDEWGQATFEPENVSYKSDQIGGVEAIWALPAGSDTSRVIVYASEGPMASRAGRLVWQGKDFDGGGATAVNRFFGIKAVRGRLYQGSSWLDGRPSLVLDYQNTSLVYRRYRDEIREIAPGLYLGAMFSRTQPQPTFTRYFAFEAR